MTDADEQTAARYLLGRLEDREREAFELRFIDDPLLSDTVASVESELFDDYLSGDLSAADREAVERNLLVTPEQRQRLTSARALRAVTGRSNVRLSGWWWIAAAAAIAVVVTGALFLTSPQPENEVPLTAPVARAPVASQPPVASSTVTPPATETAIIASSHPVVTTIVLSAVATRSEEPIQPTTLPPDADAVRLVIGLQPGDDEFETYGVVLQTAGGVPIVERSGVRMASDATVIVEIPATRLPTGDYEVLVDGFASSGEPEPLGVWSFAIARHHTGP